MDESFEIPWDSELDFLLDEDYEFRRELVNFIDENAFELGLNKSKDWDQDFEFLDDLENLDRFNLEGELYGGFDFALKPKVNVRFNQKWQSEEKTYEFSLKNIEFENFFQANTQIKLFFERVFDDFISPIKKNNLERTHLLKQLTLHL